MVVNGHAASEPGERMLSPQPADPVKVIAALLWTRPERRDAALMRAVAHWGDVELLGDPVPFNFSTYYDAEMGVGLVRQLVSFTRLSDPEQLPELKLTANCIEVDLCCDGKRTVNIDVGYLDYGKVVLASTKRGPHRIYMGGGVWAEVTLLYEHGQFQAMPWTFADFRSGVYDAFLRSVRESYKSALRRESEAGLG